jgi:hypothetical protein
LEGVEWGLGLEEECVEEGRRREDIEDEKDGERRG